MPRVVDADDAKVYPRVLANLWPEAEHQLCVFHITKKNINKLILDAVRRLRGTMSRRGKAGRRKKRGAGTRKPERLRSAGA